MPDGKALQSGTSHELGQNFARAYDITFAAEDQTQQYAWTTSWGMSWRMLGALIMTHGDDRGLRIPPKMAPTRDGRRADPEQGRQRGADVFARNFTAHSQALRLPGEARRARSGPPGNKFNDWEMRGVPLRVEIGARDLAQNQVARGAARLRGQGSRDRRSSSRSTTSESATSRPSCSTTSRPTSSPRPRRSWRTHTIATLDRAEFLRLLDERAGMVDVPWCGRPACEEAVKEATKASTRNLREPARAERCVPCGEPARYQAYFAQSY